MRLLESRETSDGRFNIVNRDNDNLPRYAILSHTWGADDEEVTFKDLVENTGWAKIGYQKLRFCARRAREHGLHYFWVDTCCINKSDLNELSESINSMFRWYQQSERCYVYLSEMTETRDDPDWERVFRSHRWFTRGWTLQELLAPRSVEFYTMNGVLLGDKRSLETIVHETTGISVLALQGRAMTDFDSEERFKWAETRQTKKAEDWAYCLIGIFNVSMPLIYGEGKEHAVTRLKREIALAPTQPYDLSAKKKAAWIVPFERNPSFTGRESEILDLRKMLFISKDYTSKVAITGLGGVGKTHIVLELLYRTREELSRCSIIWISATSKESLEQGYMNAARKLGIPGCEAKDVNIRALVRDYLSDNAAGQWLLIFDNADDLSMWTEVVPSQTDRLLDTLPRSGHGSIIFTTRDRKAAVSVARNNVVHLSSMDEKQSIKLLEGYLTSEHPLAAQRQDAIELVSQLCHLPLAIVQAAMYINANFITLSHYLELLREQEHEVIELLSEDFEDDGRYPEVKNPVATTWVISFNSIRQRSQLAANYLSFMSCVDSKDIPLSMLPYEVSSKEMMDAIGTLQAFSFVTMRADRLAVTLHRLVHLATRNWLRKEAQLSISIQIAVDRLGILLDDPNNKNRIVLRTYMPHAAYLLDSGALKPENAQQNVHPVSATSSLPEERSIQEEMGEMEEMEENFPNELQLLSWYAYCLNMEWRFQEAEVWYRMLADICKSKFGENHIFTLRRMRDLAWTLKSLAGLAEAAEIAVDVLQKERARGGDQHPETLKCMNILADIYKEQGRWEEAETLYGEVIVGLKTKFGPSHRWMLYAMNNLAVAYMAQKRWDLAAPLLEQALEGTKAALGEGSPDTLLSMNNLASTYNDQGRWEEAEALQLKALEGLKARLGEGHPDTLRSMGCLANNYFKQKRWEETEALNLKVLEGLKAQLGEGHPDTLTSMYNVAQVWRAAGRHSDAVDLLQSCLELRTQRFGKDHPKTQLTLRWLENWRAEDDVSKSPRSSSRLGSASVVGTAVGTVAERPRTRMVGSVLKRLLLGRESRGTSP